VPARIATQLTRHLGRLFETGGADVIGNFCTYPLPVHSANDYHVIARPSDFSAAVKHLLQAQEAKGLAQAQVRVIATEIPVNHRFRMWIDCVFTDSTSGKRIHAHTIFYCSGQGQRVGIEMIQCCAPTDTATPPDCTALQIA
jgi:hypothetical protein